MQTVDNAEVRIAVSKFHEYLSDRIAPLMFADSAELLLQYPASALAPEINRLKGAQALLAPGVSAADFLFHQIVLLAEDESEVRKRYRELVQATVEQVNQGHLGRASTMAELALQLVAEGRIQPMLVDTLRNTGDENLDLEGVKSLSDRSDSRRPCGRFLGYSKSYSLTPCSTPSTEKHRASDDTSS